MRNAKRVLSVLLTVLMLVNVVALSGFAMADDTVCELTITADKASYAPGDEIVLSIYAETAADCENISIAGQYILNYVSSAIEPYSTSASLGDHGFAPASQSYEDTMSQVVDDASLKADETVSAGDALIGYFINQDPYTYESAYNKQLKLFDIKMKVKDTAADGTYRINFNESSYMGSYKGTITDEVSGGLGADDTNSGLDWGFAETNMWALGYVDIVVSSAPAGPVVNYSKAGVKLNEGGYDVQLRVKSVITDADYDTYFFNTKTVGVADTAENKNKIYSVGLVAFDGVTADFDQATAEALVVNGTAAAGYKSAETDYISKADDSSDAFFGAILRGARSAFENQPITFKGFVKYYDNNGDLQVIFYETAVEKTLTTAWFTANS